MAFVITPAHQAIIDDFLIPMLGPLLRIPVHDEIGVISKDRQTAVFIYQNWIDTTAPIIKHNRSEILAVTIDYTVNLVAGTINLTTPLPPGDEIDAYYYFRYFTNSELASFIELTLRDLNSRKPATAFTIETAPLEWDGAIVLGAYLKCLQRLLMDFNLWRPFLIFVDMNAGGAFRDQISSLFSSTQTEFNTLATLAKRRGIVAPAGVSSGKFATAQLVTGSNFRAFAVQGGSFI